MRRRRTMPVPEVPPMLDPGSRTVRLLKREEVTQARAKARRAYEQRLGAIDGASPSPADIERWYGDGAAGR